VKLISVCRHHKRECGMGAKRDRDEAHEYDGMNPETTGGE